MRRRQELLKASQKLPNHLGIQVIIDVAEGDLLQTLHHLLIVLLIVASESICAG